MDLFRCPCADMAAGMKDAMAALDLIDPAHLIDSAFSFGLENDVTGDQLLLRASAFKRSHVQLARE
jgi:hypothetical protein